MASAIYPLAKQSFLTQSPSINLSSGTIKLRLVDLTTDYTYSAAHQYASSVTKYAGTTDQVLASKTFTNGVFNAANPTFTAVSQSSTKTVGALVFFLDLGGADSANPLIAYVDGFAAITPNGGDIAVAFDTGSSKIFAL